ncbi:MAG: glycerophosphodiester phosphodiesterase [Mycobacteriales bacterium]
MRILAHRGSPDTTSIENTVPAVSTALAAYADGAEVDLRLSADGILVACHDADLARLTGRRLVVADTPWAGLRATADACGVPLARLEWLLAAAGGRPLVLELKPGPARIAEVLVERLVHLHTVGLPMDVTVSSFDPVLLRAFRLTAPAYLQVRTALLGDSGCLPLAVLRQALRDGHDEVQPHVSDLLGGPHCVATAHSCGVAVVPWTVNSRRAVRRCADLGVDAVITDVPATVRLALAARPAAA